MRNYIIFGFVIAALIWSWLLSNHLSTTATEQMELLGSTTIDASL